MAEWMAFSVDDYVSNTLHLTTRQHGGYILLICAAWKAKGFLPGTDAGLMAIAKLQPKEWKDDGPILKGFLTRRGDAWVHERVEFEWNDARALIDAKSKAGKEGARKRWHGRASGKPDGTAMADASQAQGQTDAPQPLPSPTVTTIGTEAAKTGADAPRPATPPPVAVPVVEPDIDLPVSLDRTLECQALKLWNETAERIGLPMAQKLTDPRRRSLKARLSESGGLDGWRCALEKLEASSFLTGKSGRTGEHANWRCDLDFILRQQKFTKLMEGGFDDTPGNARGNGSRPVQHGGESPTAVGIAAAFARRSLQPRG